MLWMLIVMVLAFWLMSRFARKQQEKMTAQQNARIEEAMVPGTWVRTRAGFYGKVVEVDGDVVTLATPLGDESLWAKTSVLGAEEPPFASQDEEPEALDDVAEDEVAQQDLEPLSSKDETVQDRSGDPQG
ncbi:preprotein translocase subunit YajC [Actinomyces faecalis]|uniref:preprotein translocase subunit YajC n=1 Tax=Actinomyces faecalis TaxID=2722820 RepID=UPI001552358E|nr:preprotein translocase subunit YajC [Actinomyces faecalis]